MTIQSNGMGVALRENRVGIAKLMEERGWDYPIYSNFVGHYEDALLKSFSDTKDQIE